MTNTCVVYNCMNGSPDSDETVYLFHVPLDPVMKQKWEQAIPQTKAPLTTEHLVCHKHFRESDMTRFYIHKDEKTNSFTKVPYDYPRLYDTAVPSIFPGYETRPIIVENSTQPPTQVVYYNDPVQDTISDIAFYSAIHDLNRHTHCHHVGSFGSTQASSRPEVFNPVVNTPSNDISTTIPSAPVIEPAASTNFVNDAAQSSAGLQNVPNGIGESSAPIGVETVSTGIASAPIGVETASTGIASAPIGVETASTGIASAPDALTNGTTDIASVPDALTNGTAGIADEIGAPSVDYVGNGISSLTTEVGASSNTTDLVGTVTDTTSGWDNVIIDQPVSGVVTTSTPFISSGTKVDADGDGDCCGDDCCGEDCCGEDCCGEDCCGDDCCGDGCCDDCGDCDCGDECTIM